MRAGRVGGTLAAVGITVVLAWLAGLIAFVGGLPAQGPRQAADTDAIVVLTGGSGRLSEGLRLLIEGRAEKMFVSGVYRGVDVAEILEVTRHGRAPLTDRIVLGHEADDTRGNALETARWMAAENYRSLLLVTAAYHMPRSLFEFERVIDGAQIIPHPVFPENVHLDEWWLWPGTASLLAGEFTKYLLGRVAAWFQSDGVPAP